MPSLANLASLHTGYVRGRVDSHPKGQYRVISAGDLNRGQGIPYAKLERSDEITPSDRHLLRTGDVLFVPRGTNNVAAHIDTEADNLVASSQLYVIRTQDNLDAGFLSWYLNHRRAQAYFEAMGRGSKIRSINKRVLGELQVPVPPLDEQRSIANAAQLAHEEERLLSELKEKRLALIENLLLQATNKYK
jgi:restriction endonuclease S subunit